MKVIKEIGISDFDGWSGATDTIEKIIANDKESEFEQLIEEQYPDGIDETELNDFLRFEDEYIYRLLDIAEDDEEDEE